MGISLKKPFKNAGKFVSNLAQGDVKDALKYGYDATVGTGSFGLLDTNSLKDYGSAIGGAVKGLGGVLAGPKPSDPYTPTMGQWAPPQVTGQNGQQLGYQQALQQLAQGGGNRALQGLAPIPAAAPPASTALVPTAPTMQNSSLPPEILAKIQGLFGGGPNAGWVNKARGLLG